MTKVEVLKEFGKKITGSKIKGSTVCEVLKNISNKYTGSNSHLVRNVFNFTSTENQTEFEFTGGYEIIEVYANHMVLNDDEFTVNDGKVTLLNPLTANQKVQIVLISLSSGDSNE